MSRLSRVTKWKRIRAEVLARDGARCRYCGGWANTVDHVVPRRDGGGHQMSNLVACCRDCQYPSRRPEMRSLDRGTRPATNAVAVSLPRGTSLLVSGDYSRAPRR